MTKNKFNYLDNSEKENIFQEVGNQIGMSAFAVEKDWWVSRTLDIIFSMSIAQHLIFKGGTSLSKAWKLLQRFSEDVDLAIGKEFFISSKKQITKKEITSLRKRAGAYSTGIFFDELQQNFKEQGFANLGFKVVEAKDSDQDPRIIEIYYPNIISAPSEYVLPRVQIEIGCRSLMEPYSMQTFGSLIDEIFIDRDFVAPLFKVPTANPEKTFLEKLFLLHEEFQRPDEKMRVNRLSRHLYDIYQLTRVGIEITAINNKELYETIVVHRHKFSKVGGVDYNLHKPSTINPIPNQKIIDSWRMDYAKMREEMIYENNPPSFDELIHNLIDLKSKLVSVDWKFDLFFPIQS
ncbi:MAG: nucleotidyl transferase AbiEii/AbiGii toxin family protein [Bacteroidales bacterium]|nr:nucleotidyl transferase AbiEii/AbiGii toxin family protein [Bacteroidales bacterium]